MLSSALLSMVNRCSIGAPVKIWSDNVFSWFFDRINSLRFGSSKTPSSIVSMSLSRKFKWINLVRPANVDRFNDLSWFFDSVNCSSRFSPSNALSSMRLMRFRESVRLDKFIACMNTRLEMHSSWLFNVRNRRFLASTKSSLLMCCTLPRISNLRNCGNMRNISFGTSVIFDCNWPTGVNKTLVMFDAVVLVTVKSNGSSLDRAIGLVT